MSECLTRRDLMKSVLLASVSGASAGFAAAKPDTVVLMLDDKCVAASPGVTFHLNPAKKHPENPVLLPGEPHQWDSLQVAWPATVLYDAGEHKFRCWYSGLDALQKDRDSLDEWPPGYAESDDGIHWRKPELKQVMQDGHPTNRLRPNWNIDGFVPTRLMAVFENPFPGTPPSRRFGSDWFERMPARSAGGEPMKRRRLAWSPDGINWTPAGLTYELPKGPLFDVHQILCMPDASDAESRVVALAQCKRARSWDGRVVRHIAAMRGPDIEKIAGPEEVLLAPEHGIDEELHFASVSRVAENFLMLFESDRFSKNPIHGDLRLAVSSDTHRFRRVHPRDAVVSTGAKGMWDENLLVTTSAAMQEVGDEVYIFYIGCPNVYNSWPRQYTTKLERRGSLFYPTYLGLATLPRDRYGYAAGNGTVTTQPLDLGNAVWLNAEGGALDVAAIDGSGRQAAQGRLGRERFQTVYRKVVWSGTPPTGTLRLRVSLSGSDKLYSIRC